LPRLVEMNYKYADMGVTFVSIDSGVRPPAAEDFLNENKVRHTVLNDPNDDVMGAYRIVAIPVTVLVDHEGRVVFRHVGFEDEMVPMLEREIETLVAWRDEAATEA